MTTPSLAGVYSAATTPVTASGAPDTGRFAEHCKALLAEGCHGIALLGTTGEANSFGLNERQELLDSVVAAGIDPARLMPGTGTANLPDTVALTRHAVAAGVAAVVMLPPFYYKGVSDEGVLRAYCETIEAVGDARLKVVLYHIPQMSGVTISPAIIEALLKRYPDTVVGIKDSAGDIDRMREIIAAFPGFQLFAGADPLLLPVLQAGGAGCITATSNLVAAALRTVFDNHADPAASAAVDAAQAHIVAMRTLTNAYVQIPTVKAMVARRRGAPEWTNVRAPLLPLTEAERADVETQMAALEQAR
ncbi:dihydrodipicolinate synthase family protein [Acuticoccus sp. MNP-M23]|uniref:dihydrodipicolinate synthase family protein n=1 Tax=Acuticoccus sp. MNP-M23 TaxID=3072793 RepID=UPI002814C1C1|nr:dihydrodipicolinate synthase family protein [Acuticoccus sp. MNP-M23]WMS40921.1 dihydrodipicolinate synthase family protein [Acuticoccus sp. MNP-M23]